MLNWPLPSAYQKITSTHGPTGNDGKPHIGIDISCPIGTPVYAAHAGLVRYDWTQAGGNCLRLTAPTGEYTRYCHLSSFTADDYEQVTAGEEIARSGNSGASTTGAHLHWEYHLVDGTAVNPLDYIEGKVMSKLALQFQSSATWMNEVVITYWPLPGWVKMINPDVPDPFPHTHVLGRAFYHGSDNNYWERQCIARGWVGAEEYFDFLLPYYRERIGMVTVWEGPNEPDLTTLMAAQNYVAFLTRWNALMHGAGFKTCGGSIAVGNPRLAYFGESNDILEIILPALSQCDYWSYHAYWDGRFNAADDWWALRYRRIYEVAQALRINMPPLIISECGCDHGGGKLDGWRARVSWNDFWADLQFFDAEIQKDNYVVAATIFVSAPNDDWKSFEIDGEQARIIGAYRLCELNVPTQAEIEAAIGAEMQRHILPLNPEAALQKAAAKLDALPASGEFDVVVGGITYRAMAARREVSKQIVLYCVVGDWDNVKSFERAN